MKIEILHFDECPNYGRTLERVKEAVQQEGLAAKVVEVNVRDDTTVQPPRLPRLRSAETPYF
jgi:hypothetical protein